MASQDQPVGDPAFAGDERITHEPVVEEERASALPASPARRPFPWAIAAVVVAFAVAAVVAVGTGASVAAGRSAAGAAWAAPEGTLRPSLDPFRWTVPGR